MYLPREAEPTVDALLAQGKVVLVTGARQVGKTTMLREHLGDRFDYVTLDDPVVLAQAEDDIDLFLAAHPRPLIIDEIQRASELFLPIKLVVDRTSEKGQFILTGSQTYHLMKGVSESLAGRVRILELPSLSLRELLGHAKNPHSYVPRALTSETGQSPEAHAPHLQEDLWRIIHRGSMPELLDPAIDWDTYYRDYVRTYLERDLRDLIHVRDERRFYSFMVACAARTAQLFNASSIADTVGVDSKTIASWLSVLQASGIVRLIEPFWPNMEKRLSKMPKLHFMDVGLACYLTRWTTPEQLRDGAFAGQAFESFVASEVLKSYLNAGCDLRDVCFYRDARKREIDLVIQEGRVLHPVEVKLAGRVRKDATKHFDLLGEFPGYELGHGHIVCQTAEPYALNSRADAVPVSAI